MCYWNFILQWNTIMWQCKEQESKTQNVLCWVFCVIWFHVSDNILIQIHCCLNMILQTDLNFHTQTKYIANNSEIVDICSLVSAVRMGRLKKKPMQMWYLLNRCLCPLKWCHAPWHISSKAVNFPNPSQQSIILNVVHGSTNAISCFLVQCAVCSVQWASLLVSQKLYNCEVCYCSYHTSV